MTKSVIYEPTGRAGEFSELALNLYRGCPHGCLYCWVPETLHMAPEEFHAKATPRVTLQDIEESASAYYGEARSILLCSTGDPYPPDENGFTREAIKILKSRGMKLKILTKGGRRAERDFDLLVPGEDEFAVTLTCDNNLDTREWEPRAEMPHDRMHSLIVAHQKGLKTWVSLEPVIFPNASIYLMEMTRDFVDHFKVGKMNYYSHAKTINWKKFGWDIKHRMDELGVKYYLKHDLQAEMGI